MRSSIVLAVVLGGGAGCSSDAAKKQEGGAGVTQPGGSAAGGSATSQAGSAAAPTDAAAATPTPTPTPMPMPMPATAAAADAGPTATPTATATATAAAPTTCTAGAPVALAKARRTPGPLDVAVLGERTAVAWTDGGTSFVMLVDAAGTPVAPAVKLTPPGGYIKEAHLLALPTGFVVVTVEDQRYCYLRARTLDDAGQLGPPTKLDQNVCALAGYPQVALRGDLVLVLESHAYEGTGLALLAWRPGGAPAVTSLVEPSRYAQPIALSATADGFAALWAEGAEPMLPERAQVALIDAAGTPGAPTRFAADVEGERLGLLGPTPVALRAHGKSLQLRTARAWRDVAPAARGAQAPGLVTFGGRTWLAATSAPGAAPRVVPLADDGSAAGPGFDAPSTTLAHDGQRGAALAWSGKELQLHPLACSAP